MTLDEILSSLFPGGHDVRKERGMLSGSATLRSGARALVIGVADHTPFGVDDIIRLSRDVLVSLEAGDKGPILVLVDSDSQRMTKRDELLGLNEFLAHLAKSLIYADMSGRPTIGLLYGHSAAGAFLGTALATRVLAALPTADPAVMDLLSMSRVTKLPMEVLQAKAKSTPVFAPGVANLKKMGAIHVVLDPSAPLVNQLEALIGMMPDPHDGRDVLGEDRGGRNKAARIAKRVHELALRR